MKYNCSICGDPILESGPAGKRFCSEKWIAEGIRNYWRQFGARAIVVFEGSHFLGAVHNVARLIRVIQEPR